MLSTANYLSTVHVDVWGWRLHLNRFVTFIWLFFSLFSLSTKRISYDCHFLFDDNHGTIDNRKRWARRQPIVDDERGMWRHTPQWIPQWQWVWSIIELTVKREQWTRTHIICAFDAHVFDIKPFFNVPMSFIHIRFCLLVYCEIRTLCRKNWNKKENKIHFSLLFSCVAFACLLFEQHFHAVWSIGIPVISFYSVSSFACCFFFLIRKKWIHNTSQKR